MVVVRASSRSLLFRVQGVKALLKRPKTKALTVIVTFALLCTMVVVPAASGAAGKVKTSADGVKNFTVLHTNDEHSEVMPYELAADYPGGPTTGGFSRLAKTIADIKAAKAAEGEPVLTLGAGDWSQGSLFSWLGPTEAPELTLMQMMGYDAVAIGNHNVELGPGYLAAELNAARANGVNLPILSSNIIFSGDPPDPASADYNLWRLYSATDRQRSNLYVQPYRTKTLSNGLKVGMFSLLGVEAETVAPGEVPLSFGNEPGSSTTENFGRRMVVAAEMVDTLRKAKGCDVVVLVSHMGTYEEKNLAMLIPGIDVIIGGHSHDLNYPPIIGAPNNTIIVQAGAYGEYLGDLELKYDPAAETKVSVRNGSVVHMDQTVGTLPATDAVISDFMAAINKRLGFDCLGRFAETDIKGDGGFPIYDGPSMAETNLGDLIADTYMTAVNKADPNHPAQIVVEANGVIRAGIPKGVAGSFSFYDLYRSLPLGGSPYSNVPGYPLVSFYLTGAEIRGVMETLLGLGRNDFFLQVAGIKFSYDSNAEEGEKITSLEVEAAGGNGAGAEYEPIKPDALYKLAANYYTGMFMPMFGLYPRDATGKQHKPPAYPDPMKDFIVHTKSGQELKGWQALTWGVGDMPDLDSDGLPNIPVEYYAEQDRINEMATTFFFAEGTTRTNFDTYFCIQNPGSKDAKVELTYITGEGKTEKQGIMVPADSRSTVHPADVLGVGDDPAHDFSTTVACTNGQEIFVERPMYFNYNGEWTGGHDVMGATSLSETFYFAEGTCRPGFETYFCIQNPNDEDAFVNFNFLMGDGSNQHYLMWIPKNSRYTQRMSDILGTGDDTAHDFSAKFECEMPILVERPMYFNYKQMWTGGSDVVGAGGPDSTFYFAEGTCRPGFEPYFCIQNTTSADANVEITYMKGDGTTQFHTVTVPENSRYTVAVKDVLGEGDDAAHDFSAKVVSANGIPLLVERPMYFNYQGNWTGGHDVIGANYPAKTLYFAEGTCRPGFDAYFTVQNPGNWDAEVEVTYMLGSGETKTQNVTIPGNSRSTLHPADVLGTGDDAAHDFSAKVACTNGRTVIVERPMYFDFQGWTGGSCIMGH
jgi:5'-nucleotidase / UDP-sugar diphosphatase